jgi:hypothetical protein
VCLENHPRIGLTTRKNNGKIAPRQDAKGGGLPAVYTPHIFSPIFSFFSQNPHNTFAKPSIHIHTLMLVMPKKFHRRRKPPFVLVQIRMSPQAHKRLKVLCLELEVSVQAFMTALIGGKLREFKKKEQDEPKLEV